MPVSLCWLAAHEEAALALKPESDFPFFPFFFFFLKGRSDRKAPPLTRFPFNSRWSELLLLPRPALPQATSSAGEELQRTRTRDVLFSHRRIPPRFISPCFSHRGASVTSALGTLPVAGVRSPRLLLIFLLFSLHSCSSCLLGDQPSSSLFPHPRRHCV